MSLPRNIAAAFGIGSPVEQKALTRTPMGRVVPDGALLAPSAIGRPMTVSTDWNPEEALKRGYKGSVYIYRAVSEVAKGIASVPFLVSVRKKANDEWETAPEDHPLVQLLNRPNPAMSRRRVLGRTVLSMYNSGNGLVHKLSLNKSEDAAQRVGGAKLPKVVELWPLPMTGFKPIPDEETWQKGYQYQANGKNRTFQQVEILHHQFEDPANPYWGMSPLQPGATVIDTLVEALKWNLNLLSSGTSSPGVLKYESDVPLDEEQYALARKLIDRDLVGAQNAGRPWLFGGKWDWKPNTRTPVEMDYANATRLWREDALSNVGVPPVVAGFFDQATLANAEASIRLFWEGTIVPLGDMMADDIRHSLVPHFGDPSLLHVQFDYAKVPAMREDLQKKTTVLVGMVRDAGVPYNEAIELLDLDVTPVDGAGDVPFGVRAPAGLLASADALAVTDAIGRIGRNGNDPSRIEKGHSPRFSKKAALGLSVETIARLEEQTRLGLAFEDLFARELRALLAESALEIEPSAVAEAIGSGASAADVQVLLNLPELRRRIEARMTVNFDRAVAEAAKATEASIRASGRQFVLDPARLRSLAQKEAARLSRQMVESTARGVNDIIQAWRDQDLGKTTTTELARVLRAASGAHGVQLNSLRAYWEKLVAEGDFEADSLDKIARLGRNMVRERATTVATNEAFRAVHQGEMAGWRQAVQQGTVKSVKKTWVDADDSSVCVTCSDLDGQERDIEEPYYSRVTGESYDSPPGTHPECRCGQFLEILD